MRLELAVRKKEAQLTDLRGVLEAAYEDIARLEGSGDWETAAAGLQVGEKKLRQISFPDPPHFGTDPDPRKSDPVPKSSVNFRIQKVFKKKMFYYM
jgi:hypothetical protein